MFDARDPRSSLAVAARRAVGRVAAAADYVEFFKLPPAETGAAQRTWFARGQNFVVAFSEAEAGATLARSVQVDEYVLLMPDGSSAVEITTPDERVSVHGQSLVVLPPDQSSIRVTTGGRLVRVFTNRAADLLERCSNAASYAEAHPHVAPLEPWPPPPDGYRVRPYPLNVPHEEGRFGRIWRCTTIMVNWGEPRPGPRDTNKMSPHAHPDFEQCSLVLEGEFVHHLRWPWTTNLNEWRADDHVRVGSPSITVIPPTSIHTSQAVAQGDNLLIDIFCPPRVDFSEKPGWVLNADAYPIPQGMP
jgi:hypothetical protein